MSGPVANGLEQLDDSLQEVGCSRRFLARACYEWIREHDGRLAQPRFRNDRGLRRIIIEERQRAWDHLSRLEPEWVERLVDEDWRAAELEAEQRDQYGPDWERRRDWEGRLGAFAREYLGRFPDSRFPDSRPNGVVGVDLGRGERQAVVLARARGQGIGGHHIEVVAIDELGDLPASLFAAGRGGGKTATMAAAVEALAAPPLPRPFTGRVPAALVHKPGRRRRKP